MLAAIPSPSFNAIHLGRFQLRLYGVMIALGVAAAVGLATRRWERAGGDRSDISTLATWAVPAGLVGARAYHVITDPELFRGRWLHVFAIWEGGLGIPGGLLAGVGVGVLVARRRGLPIGKLLDVVAPALPLAQAIGRLGNWFNQELYGRPTDLPWALRIDPAHRPAGLEQVATYHPTFLYEALWNLALIAVLLRLERRWPARPGRLFALYVGGYALGRLWVESLRIDHANTFFGLRLNVWVSVVVLVLVAGFFVRDRMRISSP
ncbi:MAG TPA: prolipoprotein diacylglyceryl transferase [Acidimicrobiia bacterium]|nr:prolipoprotein diacylglyceryl transferase [Acidimicrobiia bacterium]